MTARRRNECEASDAFVRGEERREEEKRRKSTGGDKYALGGCHGRKFHLIGALAMVGLNF